MLCSPFIFPAIQLPVPRRKAMWSSPRAHGWPKSGHVSSTPLPERCSRLWNKKIPKDGKTRQKGSTTMSGLLLLINIRLQGKDPHKIWEKGSSQYFKILSRFLFSFYNCISVLPPMAATLGLEQTVSLLLQKDPAPSR